MLLKVYKNNIKREKDCINTDSHYGWIDTESIVRQDKLVAKEKFDDAAWDLGEIDAYIEEKKFDKVHIILLSDDESEVYDDYFIGEFELDGERIDPDDVEEVEVI